MLQVAPSLPSLDLGGTASSVRAELTELTRLAALRDDPSSKAAAARLLEFVNEARPSRVLIAEVVADLTAREGSRDARYSSALSNALVDSYGMSPEGILDRDAPQIVSLLDAASDRESAIRATKVMGYFARDTIMAGVKDEVEDLLAPALLRMHERLGFLPNDATVTNVLTFPCMRRSDGYEIAKANAPTLASYMAAAGLRGFETFEALPEGMKSGAFERSLRLLAPPTKPFGWREKRAAMRLQLSASEAIELHAAGESLPALNAHGDPEPRARLLLEKLAAHVPAWNPDEVVYKNFVKGAELFGYARMFRFLSQTARRHDAMQGFDDVLALARHGLEQFGIKPQKFYNLIMLEAWKDGRRYESGPAIIELSRIARLFDKSLPDNGTLAALSLDGKYAEALSGQMFSSWRALRTMHGYQELVRQSGTGARTDDPSLRTFVTSLLEDSGNRVDMRAVNDFIIDPKRFFLRKDSSRPYADTVRMNLVDERLGLTPDVVRRSIVDGTLDTLQWLPPMRIRYEFPRTHRFQSLAEGFNAALHTAGAVDREALRERARELLRRSGAGSLDDLVAGRIAPHGPLATELQRLLYDPACGFAVETDVVTAEVHPKSDGAAARAGDDTVTCMPWGSGKLTSYLLNPTCAFFTQRVVLEGGRERTFAESLLLAGQPAVTTTEDSAFELLQSGRQRAMHVTPGSTKLIVDNIEIAPNFRSAEWKVVSTAVYQDALTTYRDAMADAFPSLSREIPIGITHEDPIIFSETTGNTSAPIAPLLYSDHRAKESFLLPEHPGLLWIFRTIERAPAFHSAVIEQSYETGARALRLSDTVPLIAALDAAVNSGVYPTRSKLDSSPVDFEQYMVDNITRQMLQYDLLSRGFGTPELGAIAAGEDGRVQAVVVAAEALIDDPSVCLMRATCLGHEETGRAVARRFAEAYAHHYRTREVLPSLRVLREAFDLWPMIKAELEGLVEAGRLRCFPRVVR